MGCGLHSIGLRCAVDPDSLIKPKDKFKEDHPNYRNYDADPDMPLTAPKKKRKKRITV